MQVLIDSAGNYTSARKLLHVLPPSYFLYAQPTGRRGFDVTGYSEFVLRCVAPVISKDRGVVKFITKRTTEHHYMSSAAEPGLSCLRPVSIRLQVFSSYFDESANVTASGIIRDAMIASQ